MAVIPLLFPAPKRQGNGPAVINEPDPLRLLADTDQTFQTIAGFGGADRMWGSRFQRPEEAEVAFGLGEGELGTTIGEIPKRGYACSRFARFIRPGFVRIDAAISRGNSLMASAYEGQEQIVAAIINPETTTEASLYIQVPEAETATAYVADLNKNREARPVDIKDDTVIVDILPKNVTTVIIGD